MPAEAISLKIGFNKLVLATSFDERILEKMVEWGKEPKCWYLWIPSTLDSQHVELQMGDIDNVCPHWKTQN